MAKNGRNILIRIDLVLIRIDTVLFELISVPSFESHRHSQRQSVDALVNQVPVEPRITSHRFKAFGSTLDPPNHSGVVVSDVCGVCLISEVLWCLSCWTVDAAVVRDQMGTKTCVTVSLSRISAVSSLHCRRRPTVQQERNHINLISFWSPF